MMDVPYGAGRRTFLGLKLLPAVLAAFIVAEADLTSCVAVAIELSSFGACGFASGGGGTEASSALSADMSGADLERA